MSLSLAILSGPGGTMLADSAAALATDLVFSNNQHGYKDCSGRLPVSLAEADRLASTVGRPHLEIKDAGGEVVWEGRIEDPTLSNRGFAWRAFGYQRAMSDVPYTALWSTTSVADWEVLPPEVFATSRPEKYAIDNNNRLFVGLLKNEAYTNAPIARALIGYRVPDSSVRNITTITFTYAFLASADWQADLFSQPSDRFAGSSTAEWTLVGTGVLQSGTTTITLSGPTPRGLIFNVAPRAPNTYAGETGDHYLKITGIRIKSTSSSTVYANEIATALAAFVNGINATQIRAVSMLIQSPTIDLMDEVYQDRYPADILGDLIKLGDNQTPPRTWEWGVWNDRVVHLRPRASAGRAWYVDLTETEMQRTIETLRNSVYATYQDLAGFTLRTVATADAFSVTQHGLTRQAAVQASTTSSTQAGVQRDMSLQDGKDPMPRIRLKFDRLFDARGAWWPAYYCQAGDTITIRNLSLSVSSAWDRLRTFVVSEAQYQAQARVLTVTPEEPLPGLDVYLARLARGTNSN